MLTLRVVDDVVTPMTVTVLGVLFVVVDEIVGVVDEVATLVALVEESSQLLAAVPEELPAELKELVATLIVPSSAASV